MADISPPNNPATKIESAVDDQDATPKNNGELQSGSKTTVEGPGTPATKGKTEEERRESREWWKTVFTGLAFIVSCLALVFSCLSYSVSKRSATAAERSATAAENSAVNSGKTADAAQKNVATAQAALNTTIENSRLDQRAWVGVLRTVAPELKVGGKTSFGVTLVNSGKTPARKMRSYVAVLGRRAGESFSYPDYPLPPQSSVTILSPQIPTTIYEPNVTRTFVETEVEDIKNKQVTLYLFGKVSYEDIAGQAHCRTFCYRLSPDLKLAHGCETYNEETDAQCLD